MIAPTTARPSRGALFLPPSGAGAAPMPSCPLRRSRPALRRLWGRGPFPWSSGATLFGSGWVVALPAAFRAVTEAPLIDPAPPGFPARADSGVRLTRHRLVAATALGCCCRHPSPHPRPRLSLWRVVLAAPWTAYHRYRLQLRSQDDLCLSGPPPAMTRGGLFFARFVLPSRILVYCLLRRGRGTFAAFSRAFGGDAAISLLLAESPSIITPKRRFSCCGRLLRPAIRRRMGASILLSCRRTAAIGGDTLVAAYRMSAAGAPGPVLSPPSWPRRSSGRCCSLVVSVMRRGWLVGRPRLRAGSLRAIMIRRPWSRLHHRHRAAAKACAMVHLVLLLAVSAPM